MAPIDKGLAKVFQRIKLMADEEHHVAGLEKGPSIITGECKGMVPTDRTSPHPSGVDWHLCELHKFSEFLRFPRLDFFYKRYYS
jgi:hypothetical protein